MGDYQEVLRKLPKLSKAELVQVRQRVQLLVGTGEPSLDRGDWLFEGIASACKKQGTLAHAKALEKLKPKNYAEVSASVRQYLCEGYGAADPAIKTPLKLALAELTVDVLRDHLSWMSVPIGPKIVLTNLDKVPAAFEDAFPGYWASRKFALCVRTHAPRKAD